SKSQIVSRTSYLVHRKSYLVNRTSYLVHRKSYLVDHKSCIFSRLSPGTEMSNRPHFVNSAAAVGAAFHIVPRHVLGCGFTAPSDTVRLAAIGIGGKGESDITGIVRAGASVAALCDVDWRAGRKSFGRFPDARRFKDFREMFAEMAGEIDAVSISTPDHTHTVATMAALRLGKPVFCQKPLTRTLGEVR